MEAKFKIGDEVWVMHDNKPISFLVYQHSIITTAKKWCDKINYKLLNTGESTKTNSYGLISSCPKIGQIEMPESKVFATKQELISTL